MSRKPSVWTTAVFGPLRWITVFVAIVVPWMNRSTPARYSWIVWFCSLASSSIPVKIALLRRLRRARSLVDPQPAVVADDDEVRERAADVDTDADSHRFS